MNIPLYARNFEDRFRHKTKLEIWRNKEQEIVDMPFKPYFYSRKPRDISVASEVEMERLKFISDLHEEELYKYSFDSVQDIPLYRDADSLECDIPYLQRVAIDREDFYTKYPQTNDLDMLYFDIETDTTGMFPKPKRNIIAAISYAFNDGDLVTYEISDVKDGDAQILEPFFADIKRLDPDCIVGFNQTGFDLPYVIDRAIINGISTSALTRNRGEASFVNQEGKTIMNIQGRAIFDVLEEVWKDQTLYGISGRGLKEVARWFNVEKKIQQDSRYKGYKVILEYRGNIRELIGTKRLKDYVESDVLITRALSNFYFRNVQTLSQMLGVPISLMTRRTVNLLGTIKYARDLRKDKIISDAPNFKRFPGIFGVPIFDERRRRYLFEGGSGIQGATVGLYKDGKSLPLFSELREQYDDIWKVDFKGMYGSVQRTHNLSPETTKIFAVDKLCKDAKLTWVDKGDHWLLGVPDRKMGYVTIKIIKKEGFLPKMLAKLYDEREVLKEQLKNPDISEHDKEALGSLSWTIKVQSAMNYGLNGSGYFRYGDVAVTIATTGLSRHYLQFILNQNPQSNIASDTDGLYLKGKPDINEYNGRLNEYITREFGIESFMELELEGPFSKGYFLKRKNYLLLREDGNIIKHGNSFKGSNKNIIFAYALERLTKAMFNEPDQIELAIKDCFKLDERDIKDFVQRTNINRSPSEYDSGSCLQVSLANQMARFHEIEIEQGDSIEYVKQESGYVIKDLARLRKIDKRYYVRQVESVLKRLNLQQVKTSVSKQLSGNRRFTRGRSGYVYECDGHVSRQATLC